jgi:protein-S-isoprenylcysteine O-methyltransferase Ste14
MLAAQRRCPGMAASVRFRRRSSRVYVASRELMPDAVRLVVVVIASAFVLVGGYCRIRSQRGGERLDRTEEGWPNVRNPMYTGVLAAGLSLGLALGTWATPIMVGLAFTLLALRTRTEEKYLIDRFGDQYRDYMKRVGRFVPRLVRERRA